MISPSFRWLFTACLLAVTSLPLTAQSPLDEYVTEALANDHELVATRLVESERILAVDLAAANRRPSVDLRSDYLLSVGGRRIAFPIGDLFNPTYATLNQLTGTEEFPTNLENVDEQFLPSNFHDTRIEARLPLVQPLIGRETELRKAQLLEAQAGTAVAENDVRRQVRQLYYGWLQAEEGIRIVDSSRTVLLELLRINRVLLNNDKVTADAVYRTEAELAELDGRAAALRNRGNLARAALNRLRGRPLAAALRAVAPESVDTLLAPLSELRTRALANRPEFRQLDAGDLSLQRLAALQEAGGKPTLGAFLNAGAQGFFGGDLSEHPYASGGLSFAWNLYDGRKRDLTTQQTRVRRDQLAARRRAAATGIELEIYQARENFLQERAQLAAARAAARAAEAAYAIVDARYRNQQAITLELLDARNALTTARLESNLARYRMLQARADLRAAVGE